MRKSFLLAALAALLLSVPTVDSSFARPGGGNHYKAGKSGFKARVKNHRPKKHVRHFGGRKKYGNGLRSLRRFRKHNGFAGKLRGKKHAKQYTHGRKHHPRHAGHGWKRNKGGHWRKHARHDKHGKGHKRGHRHAGHGWRRDDKGRWRNHAHHDKRRKGGKRKHADHRKGKHDWRKEFSQNQKQSQEQHVSVKVKTGGGGDAWAAAFAGVGVAAVSSHRGESCDSCGHHEYDAHEIARLALEKACRSSPGMEWVPADNEAGGTCESEGNRLK